MKIFLKTFAIFTLVILVKAVFPDLLIGSTISGRILEEPGAPIGGIWVRAWDSDGPSDNDFIAETYTDSNGYYRITYKNKDYDARVLPSKSFRPDIYLNVLRKVGPDWVRVRRSKVYEDHRMTRELKINLTIPKDDWSYTKMTPFDPKIHGWPFVNNPREICGFITCKEENIKIEGLRDLVRFNWALCGGMSLTALKRYLDGKPVKPFSENVKKEIVEAQVYIVSVNLDQVISMTAGPDFPHVFALHTIGHSTKQEWETVKKSLERRVPIVLGLIRRGPTNDPSVLTDNHFVLAIGYSWNNGTKEVKIFTYDPSHEIGKISEILFNTSIPNSQIRAREIPQDEYPLRGFFAARDPVESVKDWFEGAGNQIERTFSPNSDKPFPYPWLITIISW